jgi:hypothetical protein
MGQPRPSLFVPHFTLAPPAPAPPAPQPAAAGPQPLPDNMRVTRSLQRHNNIPLLPPLTGVYKQFPFMYNQSVASGSSLVSDIYGLPLVCPGCHVPTWIKRRRHYLKKLSPAVATLSSPATPSLPSTTLPMMQIGPRPCLRPPSLLQQTLCHRARLHFLLQRPLSCLRSLLWSRPTRTVYHRFHCRTCRTPVGGCFSNAFCSSTLKLLLVVCLILLLRDPPTHRLLHRPTLLVQDVFSPGP